MARREFSIAWRLDGLIRPESRLLVAADKAAVSVLSLPSSLIDVLNAQTLAALRARKQTTRRAFSKKCPFCFIWLDGTRKLLVCPGLDSLNPKVSES